MTFLQGFTQVLFYFYAIAALTCAFGVITARNPVKAILLLVLTFVFAAAVWLFLQAEFLALILVVVYVGAVMTLFLFVVMMLNVNQPERKRFWTRLLPVILIVILLMLIMMVFVLRPENFGLAKYSALSASAHYSNVAALGMTLYSDYIFPFEVAGVLLLVAMVAAIVLTYRGVRKRKTVNITDQLMVRKSDRLRVIKMKAEPKNEGEK
jgi:NADH-quinone oxidoreductase subunit J